MDSSPLPRAPNGGKRRVFEICKLDENGEIDECSVYEEEDLPAVVGIDRATTMLSDPDGAELFFVKLPLTWANIGSLTLLLVLALIGGVAVWHVATRRKVRGAGSFWISP